MRKFAMSAIVAAGFMLAGTVQAAGSDTATFNVNLTLTPTCMITAAANGADVTTRPDIDIGYTAFQAGPGTGSTGFFVRCSTSLLYDVGVDNATNFTDGTTGLAYNLAVSTNVGGDASTAVPSLTGLSGVAAGTQYYVHAYVGAGQAGTTSPGTANKLHTITVSY